MADRTKLSAAFLGCFMTACVATSADAGDFIGSGSFGPAFVGKPEPFEEGLTFRLGADTLNQPPDPPDFVVDWIFELEGLTSANEGDTFVADGSHPNWAIFEAFLTNGVLDAIAWQGDFEHVDSGTPFGEFHMNFAESFVLFDMHGGDPDFIDLQGFDLTEVHLTFVTLEYKTVQPPIPGFPPAHGYEYAFRLDFYGVPVPAPGVLALVGFGALAPRRRRMR